MTKPSTSGDSKKGSSKKAFKSTGNSVLDLYQKAADVAAKTGKPFSYDVSGLGRGHSGFGIAPVPKVPTYYAAPKPSKPAIPPKGTVVDDAKLIKRPELSAYKWNLPPHTWSLPVKPEIINEGTSNALGDVEQYRRGRLWWYASVDSTMVDATGKDPRKELADRTFGFQFIWNPDSYTTGVSLNTDVTPNVNDRFVGVAGAFPSGETISFNLRLDRTNDFAAARNLLKKDYAALPTFDEKTGKGVYKASTTDPNVFTDLLPYYATGLGDSAATDKLQKIKDLMELGTVADLEYLYKAVNGDGWHNASGRRTSDIGYLAATLLRVDIGPLSYIGYILSLSVNHVGFSQDMTPIRTDVSISMNLMASAGQDFTNTGNNAPGATQ
jgi:hypothetical protein